MVPMHHALLRFNYFISICCENLVFMEFKLHVFIVEHLSEYGPLVQVDEAKYSFAKFNLDAIHLNFVFDLVDDFKIRIFSSGQWHFIFGELIVIININDL